MMVAVRCVMSFVVCCLLCVDCYDLPGAYCVLMCVVAVFLNGV